jgi:hypothetical protein
VTQLLTQAVGPQNLTPQAAPGGGGPGGGGAPGGGGGGGAVPTGRTQGDPIRMNWYKSPGRYPISIQLQDGRYFFTEPDWLPVPDVPDLADVRRSASTDEHGRHVVRIGVSPASKFYPKPGNVWPRVRSGVVRTGVKQDQFRRLLAAQGFSWGSQEADHVRDLQWAGQDAYENLWPLDAAANNAANQILAQPVTYRDHAGVIHSNVPLRDTPLNLYFRIDSIV